MASEESAINCDDLEDGEIESDEEEEVPKVEQESPSNKKKEKSPSPRKSNEGSRKSVRTKSNQDDQDDFMSNIESKIANVLKEKGVEPPMPSIKKHEVEPEVKTSSSSSRNSRKRRKRKERKEQKREAASSKKRPKLSDDNLYMVGGSPDNSGSESDHSNTSYSSYDSDDYHRSSYEDRRNKRRDKYGSRNERDRKDRRNRDSEKEVCLRFAEYGHCPDEDCTRLHEVRQPKKMELCKFWLMECCAKKDKCSYMHGDFPCKYYYLGLKCINKDCKFMHGKPLSDNLKQILLKHLDTAPKEILGEFPRIGRENASKMINSHHIKLCQEYNIPLPETEKQPSNKIPSLLEMKLNPPDEYSKNDSNRKDSGRTSSRWKDAKPNTRTKATVEKAASTEPGDTLLTEMRGILTDKQIETMASIGVKTVNHINNLTVSQINEIGLSLATIGEIQATAINMHNKTTKESEEQSASSPLNENNDKDEAKADIDMRIFTAGNNVSMPLKSPDTIMSPNQSDMETQENKPSTSASKTLMMSPPSAIDYSQYLRDSNFNNDDENEDEPGLKIDYASDCETDERKDSQSEDDQQMPTNVPLLPPSFDTSAFLNSASTVLSKVDISSSIQQLMEKSAPNTEKESSSGHRDPRVRNSNSTTTKNNPPIELSSPTYKEPISKSVQPKQDQPRRTSIYEIESPDEDLDVKIDKDKDMRVPFMRDSENGDIDFRFPFAPMTNYIPATEIEASYGTHVFNEYKVKIVDIPKPDYSEIKRNFHKMDGSNIQDPRLKKLYGQLQEQSNNSSGTSSNLDPRKRRLNDSKDDSSQSIGSGGPRRLQITTILQNSKHYNELSSSQKMIVNEILSDLSKQLKIFHNDKSPSKIFDTSFITQNPRLSQILIGLGVFVNAEGEFEEIKDMQPIATPPVVLPNVHQMPPIIPNLLQQPPPNLMMQPPGFLGSAANLRPGLLGIAPPTLPPFNFDPQGSTVNNQPFGNEQNFNNNRNQRGNNNSNNFRNNSHHRNNNYRSNNRR